MMGSLAGEVEPLGPWTPHIQAMDQAVAENDPDEFVRAWRQAYSAALKDPGWRGLFTVASASLRGGVFPGLAGGAAARARETYWIAFFRARQQRSLTGVLRAAEAFATLGDRDTVERCVRVVEELTSGAGDAAEVDRIRLLVRRLADQTRAEERSPLAEDQRTPAHTETCPRRCG